MSYENESFMHKVVVATFIHKSGPWITHLLLIVLTYRTGTSYRASAKVNDLHKLWTHSSKYCVPVVSMSGKSTSLDHGSGNPRPTCESS